MFRKTVIVAAAMLGLASLTVAAYAEDNGGGDLPPSCPGGTVPKGVFHCTGPVFWPTCRETGPWVCVPAGGVRGGLEAFDGHRLRPRPLAPVGVVGAPVRGTAIPGGVKPAGRNPMLFGVHRR